MADRDGTPARARWARLRFSIIGPLLAAPVLTDWLIRAFSDGSSCPYPLDGPHHCLVKAAIYLCGQEV